VDVLVVLALFVVVGALLGALWPQLVDPVVVTRNEFGLLRDEAALSRQFDNDAWYAVLACLGGAVLGLVSMAWRRTNEVVTLLAVVVGAFLAAWVSAEVGTWLGPEDPTVVLRKAAEGATAEAMVVVESGVVRLLWPMAAVVGALLVLWSPPGERVVRPHR
jgi:hypothetical protein